jgi:hypothetical protein
MLISYLGCFRCVYAVRAGKPAARASHLRIHDPISRRAEPESPMRSQDLVATVVADVSYRKYGQSSDLVRLGNLLNSLLVTLISEAVARVEYGYVVYILHIALLEVGRYAETLA